MPQGEATTPPSDKHVESLQDFQLALYRKEIDRPTFEAHAKRLAAKPSEKRTAELSDWELKFQPTGPRSLDELPSRRQLLMQSDHSKSREIGQRLEALQQAREAGGVASHSQFVADAVELGGDIADVRHDIPKGDYSTASADLGLQCQRFQSKMEMETERQRGYVREARPFINNRPPDMRPLRESLREFLDDHLLAPAVSGMQLNNRLGTTNDAHVRALPAAVEATEASGAGSAILQAVIDAAGSVHRALTRSS